MSSTPKKVIQIDTEINAVSDILKCDNYLMIGTKNEGMHITYSYQIGEEASWLEMALLLGYIEMIKDRILCGGEMVG